MKCINCSAEIKPEYKICPYCGTTIQIVPDYSVYDEDDINIIVENVREVEKKPEVVEEKKEERVKEKERAAEIAKQRKMKITIAMVLIACMLLVITGIFIKVMIDENQSNSFSYQMKQADKAMFKGEVDIAERYYLRALALEPDNIDVRLELADLYLNEEDTDEAEMYLKEVISLDKDNYDAYRMLFGIYKDAGDTDAVLQLKEGVTNERILSIFSNYSVDAPTLSVKGGTYKSKIKLTITAKKGVEIYYTLDGSDPKVNGTKYTSGFELKGLGMHTVKVVTKNELGVYSDVVTETYIIQYDAPSDPIVTPNGGTFDNRNSYIYITVPSGCSAYYTWDRTDPTEQSQKYGAPILVPAGKNMLSVIIIDDETGLSSVIYHGIFENTAEDAIEVQILEKENNTGATEGTEDTEGKDDTEVSDGEE